MAKLNKDLKKKVEFIQGILGEDYNEWLNGKHKEYIENNNGTVWKYAKKGMEYEKKLKENQEEIEKENLNYNISGEEENSY
ncbi:hypothetical protein QJR26_18780 (plasmid) [Clostridium baratii]